MTCLSIRFKVLNKGLVAHVIKIVNEPQLISNVLIIANAKYFIPLSLLIKLLINH